MISEDQQNITTQWKYADSVTALIPVQIVTTRAFSLHENTLLNSVYVLSDNFCNVR